MCNYRLGAGFLATWVLCLGMAARTGAEESTQPLAADVAVPADAKFVISLDFAALQGTPFGKRLVEMAQDKILEELAKESGNADAVSLDKIHAVLGFDPFENIERIWIFGSNYQRPQDTAAAVIDLKETTGNLEGWMLAMPGYRAMDFKGTAIHSAIPDGDQQLFAAIQDRSDHGKRILITTQQTAIESLLGYGSTKRGTDANRALFVGDDPGVLRLFVRDLPVEEIGEGPHANVARIIDHLALAVSEADDELNVTMSLTAKKPEQAEQLRQMTQGLLAAMQFAQAMEPDDEDLQTVVALLRDTKTEQQDNTTKISVRLASEKLLELIERELK